jgi:hypothetical protein
MINIYGKGGHANVINSILSQAHLKQINFWNDESYEKDERFQVILTEATGGARFDDETDGSSEHEIAVIKIVNDRELRGVIDKLR